MPHRSPLVILGLGLALACSEPANSTSSSAKAGSTPEQDDGRPPLDAKQAKQVVAAFADVPPELTPTLAAQALFELETGRLPPDLLGVLEQIPQLPPEMRGLVVAKALAEPGALAAVDHLCSGQGRQVMIDSAQIAPGKRNDLVWTRCELQRLGLVTKAQLGSLDPTMLLLAHVVLDALEAKGSVERSERKIIEHLLAPANAAAPMPF